MLTEHSWSRRQNTPGSTGRDTDPDADANADADSDPDPVLDPEADPHPYAELRLESMALDVISLFF